MPKSLARTTLPVLALALAALGACGTGTDLPLAPSWASSGAAGGGAAADAGPWSGRCEFAAERLNPTLIRVTGTCQLTHLGRATYVNLQTLVPGPVTQFRNATTYTAANGDLLHTTAVGTATPTDGGSRLSAVATETVIGGTGRFARAGGQAAFVGTVFLTGPAAGTGFYELTGTLISPMVGHCRGSLIESTLLPAGPSARRWDECTVIDDGAVISR